MAILTRIKTKLYIPAQRKVTGLLEGAYASLYAGRSLDFVDLRPYVPGDDVKDIDWKATARSDDVLVKRYVADRKHTIVIVVNSGRQMAAAAGTEESVADVGLMAAGLVGWLAVSHGDYACVAGTGRNGTWFPRPTLRETELERMLLTVQEACQESGPEAHLPELLRVMAGATRRRTVVFIISPDIDVDEETLSGLRRLTVQHQVVYITITDLNPTGPDLVGRRMVDLESKAVVPEYVVGDVELQRQWREQAEQRATRRALALDKLNIVHTEIGSSDEVIARVLGLLGRMRYGHDR